MTTSFFNPVILIPETKITEKNLVYILKHELVHIHNNDYIYKLLGIAVIIIHWFNPFAYLMFKQISVFSEYNCDEFIVKDLNKEQRIEYGLSILEFSGKQKEKTPQHISMSLFGSNDKKVMRERLTIVKQYD